MPWDVSWCLSAGDVAHGIHPLQVGALEVIGGNEFRIIQFQTPFCDSKIRCRRLTTYRPEDRIKFIGHLVIVIVSSKSAVVLLEYSLQLCTALNSDPRFAHLGDQRLTQGGIEIPQQPVFSQQHRHSGAQAMKDPCEFGRDVACADYQR